MPGTRATCGGFLLGKKYLIHDRYNLFNKQFDSVFKSIEIKNQKTAEEFQNKELKKRTRCITEFFGNGNVGNFIKRMNQFAREIGMNQTHYYNPHGLPGKNAAADNVSTAEDMARLAIYTLTKPELMKFFSTRIAGFRSSRSKAYQMLINHNGLLLKGRFGTEGVDGLKTGFTNRAGFCSTITCQRNGRRMVAMVSGFPSATSRDKFLRDLLNWGYRQK